jgi:hypothetical protein
MVARLYVRLREWCARSTSREGERGFLTAELVVLAAIVVVSAAAIATVLMVRAQHKLENTVQP